MKVLTDKEVVVIVSGHHISGTISGNESLWHFRSEDPYFLSVFPSGMLLSFNVYGTAEEMAIYRDFHNAVCSKLKEVITSDQSINKAR